MIFVPFQQKKSEKKIMHFWAVNYIHRRFHNL